MQHFVVGAPQQRLQLRFGKGTGGRNGLIEFRLVEHRQLAKRLLVHAAHYFQNGVGGGVAGRVGVRHGVRAELAREVLREQRIVPGLQSANAPQRQPVLCARQVADLPRAVTDPDRRHAKPLVSGRLVEEAQGVVAGEDDLLNGQLQAGHEWSRYSLLFHGYSIWRAVFAATSLPSSLPTTCRLMSIPAAIPAEQMTRPLSTKRRSACTVVLGAVWLSRSSAPWWVVASSPSSSPAFASSSAPVQTDRISSAFCDVSWIQSIRVGLCISLRVPSPPGTSSRSGCGQSASRWCGLTLSPWRASVGPARSATVRTL